MQIPGFVDLQVNGHLGTDFGGDELTDEACAAACRKLLASGTAGFLATVSTAPLAVYERSLPLLARCIEREEFRGRLLGIHVEGPFLSRQPGAVGAHNPDWIREGDLDLLKRLLDLASGHVKLLTLAPEAGRADELTRYAVRQGVTVSVGHTMATPDDLDRLVAAGATAFTHLGNGLPNLIPRHHNPIWAALACDELTIMLITDGHHLPAPMIKAMIRAKGVARTVVVSDASHLAGLPPGNYSTIDNEVILEPSGRLHNPAKACLVGSSATMLQCMNHLASLDLLSLDELLAVGFHNPLRLIGLDPALVRPTAQTAWTESGGTGRFSVVARDAP